MTEKYNVSINIIFADNIETWFREKQFFNAGDRIERKIVIKSTDTKLINNNTGTHLLIKSFG